MNQKTHENVANRLKARISGSSVVLGHVTWDSTCSFLPPPSKLLFSETRYYYNYCQPRNVSGSWRPPPPPPPASSSWRWPSQTGGPRCGALQGGIPGAAWRYLLSCHCPRDRWSEVGPTDRPGCCASGEKGAGTACGIGSSWNCHVASSRCQHRGAGPHGSPPGWPSPSLRWARMLLQMMGLGSWTRNLLLMVPSFGNLAESSQHRPWTYLRIPRQTRKIQTFHQPNGELTKKICLKDLFLDRQEILVFLSMFCSFSRIWTFHGIHGENWSDHLIREILHLPISNFVFFGRLIVTHPGSRSSRENSETLEPFHWIHGYDWGDSNTQFRRS